MRPKTFLFQYKAFYAIVNRVLNTEIFIKVVFADLVIQIAGNCHDHLKRPQGVRLSSQT